MSWNIKFLKGIEQTKRAMSNIVCPSQPRSPLPNLIRFADIACIEPQKHFAFLHSDVDNELFTDSVI
jgi:hypothetical protein